MRMKPNAMRCPLCGAPVHAKIAYVLPPNRAAVIPPNTDPCVCRSCFTDVMGYPPLPRDLVANQ